MALLKLHIVDNDLKSCSRKDCETLNPQSVHNFGNHKLTKDLLRPDCKDCRRRDYREWRSANTEKAKKMYRDWHENSGRNLYYIKKYNITLQEYNNLFTLQEGKCKICEAHQSELKTALAVDHCHKTGKIRGLLCTPCNLSLGALKDSEALLLKALQYLKDNK